MLVLPQIRREHKVHARQYRRLTSDAAQNNHSKLRTSEPTYLHHVRVVYTENLPFHCCHRSNCLQILHKLATLPPEGWEHSPLHNGLGLTPAAAVRLARPINALGDDQPTPSALYYDVDQIPTEQ